MGIGPVLAFGQAVLALGLRPRANTAALRPIQGQYPYSRLITYNINGSAAEAKNGPDMVTDITIHRPIL